MLVPERTQETACPRRLPLLGNPLRGRGVTAPPPPNHVRPETAGICSGCTPPRDRDVATFDRRAGSYERDWRSEFHTRVVATAAEVALATLPHPASVLDVGCGTGALLRTLADRLSAGVALSGVDPAPAMLEVSRAAVGQHSRVWLARRLPSGFRSGPPASIWW
jgi:hypothetical protein